MQHDTQYNADNPYRIDGDQGFSRTMDTPLQLAVVAAQRAAAERAAAERAAAEKAAGSVTEAQPAAALAWARGLLDDKDARLAFAGQVFGHADADGSGSVEGAAAIALMQKIARAADLKLPSIDQMQELLESCEQSGDGSLQLREFQTFFKAVLETAVKPSKGTEDEEDVVVAPFMPTLQTLASAQAKQIAQSAAHTELEAAKKKEEEAAHFQALAAAEAKKVAQEAAHTELEASRKKEENEAQFQALAAAETKQTSQQAAQSALDSARKRESEGVKLRGLGTVCH